MSLRARLNLPREHGAWAMLIVSYLLGVLVSRRFDWMLLSLGLSALFVFISRESLLAFWRARRRGKQAKRAGALLVIYLALAALSGVPLLFAGHLTTLLPMGLAAAALLVINGQQGAQLEDRTVASELLAIGGITLVAPAAYAVGSGGWQWAALALWLLAASYFASSVFYVKLRVLDAHARRVEARVRAWRFCLGYHISLFAALVILGATGSLPLFTLIAFAPALGRAFWTLARPSGNLSLKRIGMLEIAYSTIFLLVVTAAFRTL